jgi:hypothetical protein
MDEVVFVNMRTLDFRVNLGIGQESYWPPRASRKVFAIHPSAVSGYSCSCSLIRSMSRYRFVPQRVPAMCRRRAATNINAERPSRVNTLE